MVVLCTSVYFLRCKRGKARVGNTLAKKEISTVSNKTDTKKSGFVWTTKKKIAAAVIGVGVLALIVFLVLVIVFDLGPLREIPRTDEEARVVGQSAGYDVYYDEIRYLTLTYRAELDARYGKYDTLSVNQKAEYESELNALVLGEIKSNYAILALCDEYGIRTDSKDVKTHVKEAIEDLVDEIGGRDKYEAWLVENNLTDALLRFIYKVDYLESLLLEELTVSGQVVEFTPANIDSFVDFVMNEDVYAKVIHLYYPRQHDLYTQRGSSMETEVNAAIKALNGAKNDDERYNVMKSLIGTSPYVYGYSVEGLGSYITYGQMHENYENAAFALDDYGVSEIIELEEGCYVIMRLPKEREEVARKAYELVEYYRYAVLKQLKDAKQDNITFNGNDYFDGIKLVDIK